MSSVVDLLTELVREASVAAGYGDVELAQEPPVPTADPRHGDYQSNHAFRLAKHLRQNPRAVASAILEKLPPHPAVGGAEVAGPGFLNFRLTDAWLGQEIAQRAADARFGVPTPGDGRTLVIDYSSPNIAKRMHVGHLRSTIIGNALDRLHRFLGWNVISDNHVGDWGTQFGKLIVAWRLWRDESAYAEDPIAELQRIYQKFGAEVEAHPTLADDARAETVKLQAGDEANRVLWAEFCAASMREFQTVYDRLGVHFDVVLGESAYRDELDALVDGLIERGIANESQGAIIVAFPDDEQLKDKPLLIRKRDGASLYGTTDLATVQHRIATWNPERVVYVTDVRQQQHFQQVFAAARKMGVDLDFRHVWFGMLKFADGAVASTRSGQTVNLVDVLDEAARRARVVVDQRSDKIPESERVLIAEAVGVGAVKYADLSQNPQSDVVFEWDKMLAFQGNTAPYLMYAHARCHSILRKGGVEGYEPVPVEITHPTERELILALLGLPEVIVAAASTARPNLLADHVFGTAQLFAKFYLDCPVLRDDVEPAVRASRLTLVVATARAMELGLDLLGIKPLKRM